MMVMKSKLDNYQRLEKVGEGAYGIVYKALDKTTNRLYAMKEIPLESVNEGISASSIREIALLKDLQHPNIVKIEDFIHTKNSLIIVFEYVKYDLRKFMLSFEKQIDGVIVQSFLYQLIKGIAHCHQMKVLHRDLKPQNLLVSQEGVLKLGDFGLAKAFGIPIKSYTNKVVTLWYRAPDVLLGSTSYSTSVDIWSIGCIFAEMSNQKPLFPGTSEHDQLQKIFQIRGTPDANRCPMLTDLPEWKAGTFEIYPGQALAEVCPKLDIDGLDLLDKMLKMNPAERISAKEALLHPYFRDIPANLKKLYNNQV